MPLYRPTPPTPPTIDKGEATEYTPRFDAQKFFEVPFKREEKPVAQEEKPAENSTPQNVEKKLPTPEELAREAVANGAGALTKKTVTRPEEEKNSEVPNAPANLPVQGLSNTDSERGRAIVREFQAEDRENYSNTADTPKIFNLNANQGYSGFYWIGILIFAGILSIVFVKKFLVKKNPKLKKSELFEGSSEKLKAVSEKVSTPKINSVEKKSPPPKKDDDKGKHFEVRV
ncbi:MAG: hypothetical protein IJT73_11150 [Selenomonadaceae bacterium]|nr:hypothetical protein [Selenomonadaceae bacterium]